MKFINNFFFQQKTKSKSKDMSYFTVIVLFS